MGPSKMNNPDKLATMATQDKKKQNKKESSNGLTEFLFQFVKQKLYNIYSAKSVNI
jgi:hypothetical protein